MASSSCEEGMKKKNSAIQWSAGLVAILALILGYLFASNPLLSNLTANRKTQDDSSFTCIQHNDVLDEVLNQYASLFPTHWKHNELIAYKNHCLRVLSFAVHHYLNGTDTTNDPRSIDLMAMALAYHDLALWMTVNETAGTTNGAGVLDYLDPSVQLMKWDQAQLVPASPIPILEEDDMEMVTEMILQHHKFTPWTAAEGKGQKIEAFVNAIRCADWADATLGVVRFGGLSLDYMAYVYRHVPEAGFHETLGMMTSRLSPTSWSDQLKILRILKW
jgi:hypothetical protein